jgi:hypothetical protein
MIVEEKGSRPTHFRPPEDMEPMVTVSRQDDASCYWIIEVGSNA